MVKIKICGVTSVGDALHAAELGADAIGLNFYLGSPRHVLDDRAVEIVRELPPFVEPVAVFVKVAVKQIKKDMSELGLRTFQLHGQLPPTIPKKDSTLAIPGEPITAEKLMAQQEKLQKGDFTLNDFRKQFAQIAQMGGMGAMMKMMPGMGDIIPDGQDPEEAMKRIAAMIDSMTDEERNNPDIISSDRRREIAAASGTQASDVRQFLVSFEQIRTMMRQMATMSMWEKLKMITGMATYGTFRPVELGDLARIFPKNVHPLRFIPAFGVRDKQSLQAITAYLEKCTLLGQLPAAVLVDAHVPGSYGGTGQTLPWELLADFSPGVPLILAGGLNADNVGQAIRLVRPYAVDVASGVESSPGKKDVDRMQRFVDAVRQA